MYGVEQLGHFRPGLCWHRKIVKLNDEIIQMSYGMTLSYVWYEVIICQAGMKKIVFQSSNHFYIFFASYQITYLGWKDVLILRLQRKFYFSLWARGEKSRDN